MAIRVSASKTKNLVQEHKNITLEKVKKALDVPGLQWQAAAP